jgi:Tetratricopeptide repeat
VVFVVDDLLAWLVGLVADAGRKKLVTQMLGTDQERALRPAVEAAVEATAAQLAPSDEQAGQLAMAVGEVFRDAPKVTLAGQATLLEGLQAGIAATLAVLDDPAVTGTGQSSMQLLGVPGGVLAETLAGHLVHEITVRGAQGGPLTPLADQLNQDMTHLQGQRVEGMLAQVVSLVTALARAGRGPQVPRKPVRLAPRPVLLAGEAGDAAGARDQCAALLSIEERVLGPEHPATLATRTSLGRWAGAAGDAAGARDQYAALLPIQERVLGPEHPDTLATRTSLAYWTRQSRRRRWRQVK